MAKPILRVGMIGYQFMGRAHSNAYRQVGRYFDLPVQVEMATICGRTQPALDEAAHQLGWKTTETDWRRVVEDPSIDIIDVSTPGDSHMEIAVAAAQAGKIVFCEKPIGNTLAEAQAIYDAVKKSGKPSLIFHNYRKAPAVALAKQMIKSGKLGEIYHFRGVYLQDWIANPNFPMVWRLDKSRSGSGTHGDIASHVIDLSRHLVGEIASVTGLLHTFIKERPTADGTGVGQVTVDDASLSLLRFGSGALGTIEASRFAVGRRNYNRFEINGSKGSVVFNLERMNELEFFDNTDPKTEQGFRLIQVTESEHPYAGHYWPAGHIIGYEHTFINLLADAFIAIGKGEEPSPSMLDGLRNQEVLDAVERSSDSGLWVNLS